MRTIVIGDIHGCYAELQELFLQVDLADRDLVVSLGDIVDRGADSVKMYDLLSRRPNTIVLMGNHERKHLRITLSYSQEIVKLQFGDRYDEFLTWVKVLFNANTGNLTPEILPQVLRTPAQWLQVMGDLEISIDRVQQP
jgi:serine/threonine protein phosphatase 1